MVRASAPSKSEQSLVWATNRYIFILAIAYELFFFISIEFIDSDAFSAQEAPQNPWGRGWTWFKRFRRSASGPGVAQLVGHKFEERVARHFKTAGKFNVKQSVILTDRFGDKSEIDVVYGLFFKRYIECKTYSSKLVPLSDVAKFKEVLQLNKIPIER